jgi:NAD(P)-dependent dehydrogenase (short-subunit alcohol dehydrogenase family)
MLKQGVRINAICPGPTDTPLAQANRELWLGFGTDYREETGTEPSRPEEQAGPLAFLASDAASYVNGVTLITDLGYFPSGMAGSFEPATPVVNFLLGRY